MLFSNIVNHSINVVSKRFIRKKVILKSWPNDWVPFVWNRPEKIPGYFDSGDLTGLDEPDKRVLLPEVRGSQELTKMDKNDPMMKIFSVEHAKRRQHNKAQAFGIMKELGLIHEVDYPNSLEAKIINLTFTLRQLQAKINESSGETRYNGHTRSTANNVKYRRYRYLCELKELHGDRYERLIKALDIEPKNNPINVPYVQPFRKVQMRRLATEYARDLKEKKVEDFMLSLEKEKEDFEKYKQQTLKWIEEQENKLGVTV